MSAGWVYDRTLGAKQIDLRDEKNANGSFQGHFALIPTRILDLAYSILRTIAL